MAKIYRCDRCGFDSKEILEEVHIPAPTNKNYYRNNRKLDLCNSCITILNQTVDKLPVIVGSLD